jgi:hypothetical protein
MDLEHQTLDKPTQEKVCAVCKHSDQALRVHVRTISSSLEFNPLKMYLDGKPFVRTLTTTFGTIDLCIWCGHSLLESLSKPEP